jgi:exo-beta-1,3-glucanase (GH17 family)
MAAGATGATGAGTTGAYTARDTSGHYASVPPASTSATHLPPTNKEWGTVPKNPGRKRLTWIVGTLIVLVCIGAIVGGILGTQLNKSGKADSAEIKELLAMDGLHKVFPGVDYTPLNAQYPECMHVPPSQNNITRDIAVLSRMTNAVRLYGTDCNQTEMVLEAITRLDLQKTMKVWLGVWLGANSTTNARQVSHMHSLIDAFPADRFKGIIIGNEVLYREELTETQLMKVVNETRSHLKEKGSSLPVATSDLGDNWTKQMAEQVDAVMSNVHPFFAGVTAEEAAGWTWTFWQGHDVVLTADRPEIRQIVAEVGWPSEGGNNCGGATCTSETQGSVASIDNLNTFMQDWVCPSLRNGTEYFWYVFLFSLSLFTLIFPFLSLFFSLSFSSFLHFQGFRSKC